VKIMEESVAPAVERALHDPGCTWSDVHAAMQPYGVRFEDFGGGARSGFRVVGPEIGQHVKASSIGIHVETLTERLGMYEVPFAHSGFDERLQVVRGQARTWKTWAQAHADLGEIHLAIRDRGGSRGQIVDLDGDRTAPLSITGETLPGLERRLGPYISPQVLVDRDRREAERQADGLAQRAAFVRAEPSLVIDVIAATQATWDAEDVERAVRTKLGIGRDEYAEVIAQTTEAVVAGCLVVDDKQRVFTMPEIAAEEVGMFAAARALSGLTAAPKLREPGPDLDAQQRAAYAHLASEKQLAIVTGVAGAGKSRLQRDLAAAYAESGWRVIGVAVSGEAARTLGEEAEIDSCTVAKLLYDVESGQVRLGARDVLLIDEAGTLGTQQACQIFELAKEHGVTVRLLGDESQHESVARGAVLRGLVEDHGTYDMQTTRRAQHDWLRNVATDLREGNVAHALDALRENQAIHAYPTQSAAKEYLVRQYVAAVTKTVEDKGVMRPREAILLADSNADMAEMNGMVQRRLQSAGKLGEARTYETNFGSAVLHVGDILAIREGRKSVGGEKWVNGDRATIEAHLDGDRLRVRRERDGVRETWDVGQHGAIQLGYAMTSYRSQGKTVDDVFILPADGRRGTYVDVTRARDTVTIAYGQDRVSDFGDLMVRAQRDQGKTLVRDTERVAERNRRQQIERERREAEIKAREVLRKQARTLGQDDQQRGRSRGMGR
jgi:hypothetical protein